MSEEVSVELTDSSADPATDSSDTKSLSPVEGLVETTVAAEDKDALMLRENLVSTAVKFLQSNAVASSPLKDRQEFLRKKGLTDREINEAMNRVQTETITRHQGVQRQSENRLRNWSLFVVLFGGALYGCYKFYKEYLIPFLSDEKVASETLSTKLSENTEALSAFGQRIDELHKSCDRNTQKIDELQVTARRDNSVEIKELKDELLSLKRLLLNRSQFPDTPTVKPVLPAWQLEQAAQSTSAPPDNSSQSSVEGGQVAPVHSPNPAGTEASPDAQPLEQNGLSDSDTESMAEQAAIDQSAASPDQSLAAAGNSSEQEETTADALKRSTIVNSSAPQSASNVSDQHSTFRTLRLPSSLQSPHFQLSPDSSVDDSKEAACSDNSVFSHCGSNWLRFHQQFSSKLSALYRRSSWSNTNQSVLNSAELLKSSSVPAVAAENVHSSVDSIMQSPKDAKSEQPVSHEFLCQSGSACCAKDCGRKGNFSLHCHRISDEGKTHFSGSSFVNTPTLRISALNAMAVMRPPVASIEKAPLFRLLENPVWPFGISRKQAAFTGGTSSHPSSLSTQTDIAPTDSKHRGIQTVWDSETANSSVKLRNVCTQSYNNKAFVFQVHDIYCGEKLAETCTHVPPLNQNHLKAITHRVQISSAYLSPPRTIYRDQTENTRAAVSIDNHCQTSRSNNHSVVIYIPTVGQEFHALERVSLYAPALCIHSCTPVVEFVPFSNIPTILKTVPLFTLSHLFGPLHPQEYLVSLWSVQVLAEVRAVVASVELVIWPTVFTQPRHHLTVYVNPVVSPKNDQTLQIQPELKFSSMQTVLPSCRDFGVAADTVAVSPAIKRDLAVQTQRSVISHSGVQTIKGLYRDCGSLPVESTIRYDVAIQTHEDVLFFDTPSQTVSTSYQDCEVAVNTLIVNMVNVNNSSTQTPADALCLQFGVQTVSTGCQDFGVEVNTVVIKKTGQHDWSASQMNEKPKLVDFGVQTTCVLYHDFGVAVNTVTCRTNTHDGASQTYCEFPLASYGTQTSQVVHRNQRTMVKTRTANQRIQACANSSLISLGVQTISKTCQDYGSVTDQITVEIPPTATSDTQTLHEYMLYDIGVQTDTCGFAYTSDNVSQTAKSSVKSVATSCKNFEADVEILEGSHMNTTSLDSGVQNFANPVKSYRGTDDVPPISKTGTKRVGARIKNMPSNFGTQTLLTPWENRTTSNISLAIQTAEYDRLQAMFSATSTQTLGVRHESCQSLLSDDVFVDALGEFVILEKSTRSLPSTLASSAVQTLDLHQMESPAVKVDTAIQTINTEQTTVGIEAIPSATNKIVQAFFKNYSCSVGHQTTCTLTRNMSAQVDYSNAMKITHSMVTQTELLAKESAGKNLLSIGDKSTSGEVVSVVNYQDASTTAIPSKSLSHQSQQSDCTLSRNVAVLTTWISNNISVQTLPSGACSYVHHDNTMDQSTQTVDVPLETTLSRESHYYMAPEHFFSESMLPPQNLDLPNLDASHAWKRSHNSLQEVDNITMSHQIPKVIVQSESNLEFLTSSLTNGTTTQPVDISGIITALVQASQLDSLSNVDAAIQIDLKSPVSSKSTSTDNKTHPETSVHGYQTLISIPPGQRIARTNTYPFIANIHGISKSTLTTQRDYTSIGVATHVSSYNKTTSTKIVVTTDSNTLTEVIAPDELSKSCGDCKTSTHCKDVTVQVDVDGKFHANTGTMAVGHSEIVDKGTCVETDVFESEHESHILNSVLEAEKVAANNDDSFMNKLFEKIEEISNKIDAEHSASDTTVWDQNVFESVSFHLTYNHDNDLKNTSSSNLAYYTAVSSFVTDQDAQTDEVNATVVIELAKTEVEELGRSLVWEIIESAITVADRRRSTSDAGRLQTIVEESESDDDPGKDESIQLTFSVGQVKDRSCHTPIKSKSERAAADIEPSEDQLLRTRSEAYLSRSSMSASRTSYSMNGLNGKENLIYTRSEISDFPTVKLDDFSLQKLKHVVNPSPSDVKPDAPKGKPTDLIFSVNKDTQSPANASLLCMSEPSCSFSIWTSETDKAVENDSTLSDLSHFLDTSSSIPTLSTNSIDALLSQSMSDITTSDTLTMS